MSYPAHAEGLVNTDIKKNNPFISIEEYFFFCCIIYKNLPNSQTWWAMLLITLYTNIHAHTNTHLYIYIYIHTHTHTYIHMPHLYEYIHKHTYTLPHQNMYTPTPQNRRAYSVTPYVYEDLKKKRKEPGVKRK